MRKFNKYDFEKLIIDNFKEAIENNQILDLDDGFHRVLDETIFNECIYYTDCFNIVNELFVTDWSDLEEQYGKISDISTLAKYALMEYINEETKCREKCEELFKELVCEECGYHYDDCECEEEE